MVKNIACLILSLSIGQDEFSRSFLPLVTSALFKENWKIWFSIDNEKERS